MDSYPSLHKPIWPVSCIGNTVDVLIGQWRVHDMIGDMHSSKKIILCIRCLFQTCRYESAFYADNRGSESYHHPACYCGIANDVDEASFMTTRANAYSLCKFFLTLAPTMQFQESVLHTHVQCMFDILAVIPGIKRYID